MFEMKPASLAVSAMALGLALLLSACDAGPSAVQGRARASDGPALLAATPDAGRSDHAYTPYDSDRRSAPRRPALWSANRNHSSEENAAYHFQKDGAAFGAKDVAAFVAIAHDFIKSPPKGTETIHRSNGDTLYYDAGQNVFVVANRDGVPKTMFKPDNGAAYWEKQKTRESDGGERLAQRDTSGARGTQD